MTFLRFRSAVMVFFFPVVLLVLITAIIRRHATEHGERTRMQRVGIDRRINGMRLIIGERDRTHAMTLMDAFVRVPSVHGRNALLNLANSWHHRVSDDLRGYTAVLDATMELLDRWTQAILVKTRGERVRYTPRASCLATDERDVFF